MPQLFHKRKSRSNRAPHRGTIKLDASIQASQNHKVLSGFPRTTPFTCTQEANEYLSHEDITCLQCGKQYAVLNSHLIRIHGMSIRGYQEYYHLPTSKGLAGLAFKRQAADAARKRNAVSLLIPGSNPFNRHMAKVKTAFKTMKTLETATLGRSTTRRVKI